MLNPLSLLKHPVLLSLYFISSLAHAQIYSSASSASMAGAGRAAVEAGDVNYLNPAGLVHLRGRFFVGTFTENDLTLGLSEASKEVVVPASITYFQSKTKDDFGTEFKTQDTRLSLADFVVNKFSMGITGIMNSSSINQSDYNQTNANLGFFYTPLDTLGLGAVFYNLFSEKAEVPEIIRLQRQTGIGFQYIYKSFLRYRLDVLSAKNNNFGKPAYMTGFETLLNEWVSVRLGYQNDILANRELGAMGLGFNGPVFSVYYAYQKSIKGAYFGRHSIDLSLRF